MKISVLLPVPVRKQCLMVRKHSHYRHDRPNSVHLERGDPSLGSPEIAVYLPQRSTTALRQMPHLPASPAS